MEDFAVPRLRDSPLCKTVLTMIRGRCKMMPELETQFLRAVECLETLHSKAVQVDADDPRRAAYVDIILRLVKLTHKRPLLVRVAKCDTIADMIYQLQTDIEGVARDFGVSDEDVEMAKWRDEWDIDRKKQFLALKRLTLKSTGKQLVGEVKNDRLVEVMAALKNELKKDLQKEQLELKQAVFGKVAGLPHMPMIELVDSFISLDDLEFDDGPIVAGTFGEVRRATWFHDGKSDKVAVKQLLAPLSGAASDPFTRQLNVWQELPAHPNIVQLYGGCNVGLRQFYVCEEVFKGSLADYCRTPRSSVLVWKVLIQVAEGLEFLHERGIVHGGLTCNNILLGENNLPKLSDFGFSSIRHLSMGMSVSCYRSRSDHYVEYGSSGEARFESDIFALGKCITDALKQTIPFVKGGPDAFYSSIQRVVSKMCAYNHCDRPTIEAALAEMRKAFPNQPNFPMHGILGSPPSQKTLTNLESRIQRMPENEAFSRHLLERLQFLHDPLTPLASEDPLKLKYIQVVEQLVNLMRHQPLLLRLARCESVVTNTRELHLQLDDIGQSFGLDDEPAMIKWKQEWNTDLGEQFRTIAQEITGISERMLVGDYQGDRKAEEALMVLQSSINREGQLPEISALKQSTIDRVKKYLRLHSLPVYSSFIPSNAIEYKGEPFRCGGYGYETEMRRGTWICNDERREVAIELFRGISREPYLIRKFVSRLEWLSSIPENDHVLKVYGGSHLGAPPFYVYEKVPFGTLIDFLSDESNSPMFWRLFEQAAAGLKFLHKNEIAHGNLMCNNIVVGENYTVKLLDVGPLYNPHFGTTLHPARGHVRGGNRWKSMEQLSDLADEAGAGYEGDIYSLGMCMIEAITLELPFGLSDDDTVIDLILTGECHRRPDGVSDEAWSLISVMCSPDLTRRPTIDVVIARIQELARHEDSDKVLPMHIVPDKAKDTSARKVDTVSMCACCGRNASGTTDRYCRWCGHIIQLNAGPAHLERTFEGFLSKREKFISRHGLPAYLKSCQAIDAWRKLYEVVIAVRELHLEGITHCDLKPANIFIGRDGKAHLSFEYNNLAAKFAEYGLPIPLNEAFRWQSPEVLNGDEPTVMSDVYALGMCAIFIVGGNPPWGDGLSEQEVKLQVCNEHAMPLRCQGIFTDNEWNLISEMCDFRPDNRPRLDDVVLQLANIVGPEQTQGPEWQLSDADVVFQDDDFSQTQYVSRHVGRWKDAVVAVETVTERFKEENKSFTNVADLWFSLKHPTILQLFGACHERQAFVCEHAECGDLRSFLFRGNFTSAWSQIWQILLDVALGIRYLHAIGVVHGDVGLHNILVKRSGQGKLAGFSLSSQIEQLYPETSDSERKTASEATSGIEDAGFASDVYWFGWCIIDAFCGSESVNLHTIEARTKEPGDMQRPKVLSEEEWGLVMDMCCSDPLDRIEMPEVVKRLARLSAVNVAIDSELSKTKILLSVNQRHTLQAMVLEEVIEYEKEEEEAERSEFDDDLDDDYYFKYDPWAGLQRKKIKQQGSYSTLCGDAARSILTSELHLQLKKYRPRPSVKITQKMSRHFVPLQQRTPRWRLPHTSILETKGVNNLGTGAFASVANGIWLGASVALKKMLKVDLDHDQILRQEANLWFRLRHPHIVSLFGVCCGGSQFFVCDLVGGERLDKYCSKRNGKPEEGIHSSGIVHADLMCNNVIIGEGGQPADFGLSCLSACDRGESQGATWWKAPKHLNDAGSTLASDSKSNDKIWGLLHDAAVGLQGLHSYGIVHADLKCDNILITKDGRAQLIDFGLSCLGSCDGGEPRGAPRWKAPECLNGAGPTFASDVYSFGMCIIEAMTGEFPWGRHQDNSAVVSNVKKRYLPAPDNIFSIQEWELVRRMCCFKPEDRLQVDEVVKVIGHFAQRDPYVYDRGILKTLAKWMDDPLPAQNPPSQMPQLYGEMDMECPD